MPSLKSYSFGKSFQYGALSLYNMVVMELFRLPDILANRSFCRSEISWVQLKSNWIFRERLLASYRVGVRECRLILLKRQLIFSQCLIWKIIHLEKTFSDGALSLFTEYSGNSSQCQMALETDHFVDWTFRGSNWSPTLSVGKRLVASKTVWKSRLILSKSLLLFLMIGLEIHSFRKN